MQGCLVTGNRIFPDLCPISVCDDWMPFRFVYDGIPIVGLRKPGSYENRIIVYLEGDGRAWQTRYRVSDNPTPKNPVGLNLAIRDPRPGILYLARPCQYVRLEYFSKCSPALWSSARYSSEVIKIVDYTITQVKHSNNNQITLIGYSGGGVIAALLASRREDVDVLITIVAPLDTDAWTKYQDVSPLSESINPLSVFVRDEERCDVHFYGGQDEIVPPSTVEQHFCLTNQSNSKCVTITNYDHQCCWIRDWPSILSTTEFCQS